MWTPKLDSQLKLSGPGFDTSPNWDSPSLGQNAGYLQYDDMHGAYGGVVLANQHYNLTTASWGGYEVLRFSDKELIGQFEPSSDEVTLAIGSQECTLHASDERLFVGAKGTASGASQGACKEAIRTIGGKPLEDPAPAPGPIPEIPGPSPALPTGRPTGECEWAHEPGTRYFWDPSCINGGAGCNADGKNHECRFCGSGPFPACPSTQAR